MKTMKYLFAGLAAAALPLASIGEASGAHAGHESHGDQIESKRVAEAADHEKARAYFTDTVLKTHAGEDVRFYSDVLEGKTVVVSFIFTSCTDACPLINQNLEKIQARLGERMGEDIAFVSITVDPETDTPAILDAYRQKFDAGEGWFFLTGDRESIETVSEKLGQVFEREQHLTALLIGNTETARWRKVPAYLPDNVIASQIMILPMTISVRSGFTLLVLMVAAGAAHAQLTPSEERGRAIYYGEEGSALERATASIGGMDVALPAGSFPCSSCHGEHGQGQAERGVAPSDLSQDALTRPYNVMAAAGRVRPPYSAKLFERAITQGVDSGGTELVDAMPRFNLSTEEVEDLWVFLAKLKEERDPGISANEIRIAAALPMSGPAEGAGVSMYGVLEALASQVNEAGGIHGRMLIFIPYDEHAGSAPPEDVFAVIGAQDSIVGLPTISASMASRPGPLGFALTSGTEEQEAALRQFAVETWGVLRVETVSCDAERGGTLILADPDCAEKASGVNHLLVPYSVFASTAPDMRKTWPQSVHVALPVQIARISGGAQAAFAKVRAQSRFAGSAPLAEANIYSAAVVAIEGLVRSGRVVSRKKFQNEIEELQDFVGAMTPPISFSANDHVGSNGSHIVPYDRIREALGTEGPWIDPASAAH